MSQRPELNEKLDAATFRSFYYLKQELANFCKENGLPTSGSKAELTDRIAYFLDTGSVLKPTAERKTAAIIGTITEDTVIPLSVPQLFFRCSDNPKILLMSLILFFFPFCSQFSAKLSQSIQKSF